MCACAEKVQQLSQEFTACRKILVALGDENRQHLILSMFQCSPREFRVGDIAARVNLSRPAVSHHLKILKEAGIVNMRKVGTKNYYSIDPQLETVKRLSLALDHTMELMGVTVERQALG